MGIIPFTAWSKRGDRVKEFLLWKSFIFALPQKWKHMLKVNYNYAKDKSSISVHIGNDIIELSALKQRHVKIFIRYKKFTNLETIDWKAKSKLH